jgi:hypothetical protein
VFVRSKVDESSSYKIIKKEFTFEELIAPRFFMLALLPPLIAVFLDLVVVD